MDVCVKEVFLETTVKIKESVPLQLMEYLVVSMEMQRVICQNLKENVPVLVIMGGLVITVEYMGISVPWIIT